VLPAAGIALRFTAAPTVKRAEQMPGQSIPAGVEVTRPAPDPPSETDTRNICGGSEAKVALTEESPSSVMLHAPVPEHAPDQPAKALPDAGVAVSATGVPAANDAAHCVPQSMPAGFETTAPLPTVLTINPCVAGRCWSKFAVTVVGAVRWTSQLPVPEHPPPCQPANTEPEPATADSTTVASESNVAVHVDGHCRPTGKEVTTPVPGPEMTTAIARRPGGGGGIGVNCAATCRSAVAEMVQVPVPPHPPDHPAKLKPGSGVASKET
jgi:hypothetical protein